MTNNNILFPVVVVICVAKSGTITDSKGNRLTSFDDFINIGEKYIGFKKEFIFPASKGKETKTEFYDIYDLDKNRIGEYPIRNFKEISTYQQFQRNEKIETILK